MYYYYCTFIWKCHTVFTCSYDGVEQLLSFLETSSSIGASLCVCEDEDCQLCWLPPWTLWTSETTNSRIWRLGICERSTILGSNGTLTVRRPCYRWDAPETIVERIRLWSLVYIGANLIHMLQCNQCMLKSWCIQLV